jgi:hypothetical protein
MWEHQLFWEVLPHKREKKGKMVHLALLAHYEIAWDE